MPRGGGSVIEIDDFDFLNTSADASSEERVWVDLLLRSRVREELRERMLGVVGVERGSM